ncbi:PLD nuclease N-terminal domain-containing protein [Clostridium thermarum]|uniref:PLD nuclease N-terminal domain-containing protein n=1 Tax=Clostridium thermarum TaxID=1716543 RepID=UPI0011200D75|nr:PLD nuclease N-terminal domain-containing protein [Clostridium thermarum]
MDISIGTDLLKFLAPLIILQLILVLVCIRSIIKDEVNYLPKWAWILIVCTFNFFGPIIYLFIGRKRY